MTRVGRAVEKGETQGFMKSDCRRRNQSDPRRGDSRRHAATKSIHSLLDVMYAKAPYTTVSRAMHIHPTVSELLPTMLQDLQPLK